MFPDYFQRREPVSWVTSKSGEMYCQVGARSKVRSLMEEGALGEADAHEVRVIIEGSEATGEEEEGAGVDPGDEEE